MFSFTLQMVVQGSLFQILDCFWQFLVSYLCQSLHVQPFSLDTKPTCMQPPIYRRTQFHAGLALPDYCHYFRVVRIVRQCQTSSEPSVSSSHYKQRWQSSLHDT